MTMSWSEYINEVAARPGLSDIFVRDNGEVTAMVNRRRLVLEGLNEKRTFDQILADIFPRGAPTLDLDSFEPAVGIGRHRFRVSYGPFHGGRELSLRFLQPVIRTPEEAMLPPSLVSIFLRQISGLVIIAGEVGSGKTNTVATLCLHMARHMQKRFLTIEDPVELEYPKLSDSQSEIIAHEVGTSCRSFGSWLREARRKSANVLIIGEVRDAETAEAALRAAQTGLLVVVTIHAVDTPGAIESFVTELPKERQSWGLVSLARSLRIVVAQRLYENAQTNRLYPIHEVLFNLRHHTGIAANIAAGKFKDLYNTMDSHRADGMQSFRESLEQRVRQRELPSSFLRLAEYNEQKIYSS
jgi:Tfp pilus assembly pilus retraction ATPase PilT